MSSSSPSPSYTIKRAWLWSYYLRACFTISSSSCDVSKCKSGIPRPFGTVYPLEYVNDFPNTTNYCGKNKVFIPYGILSLPHFLCLTPLQYSRHTRYYVANNFYSTFLFQQMDKNQRTYYHVNSMVTDYK